MSDPVVLAQQVGLVFPSVLSMNDQSAEGASSVGKGPCADVDAFVAALFELRFGEFEASEHGRGTEATSLGKPRHGDYLARPALDAADRLLQHLRCAVVLPCPFEWSSTPRRVLDAGRRDKSSSLWA